MDGLNQAQKLVLFRYNCSFRKTRVLVEQVIGRWKRRYHSMPGELRVVIESVADLIVCSTCLYNFAVEQGYDVDADDEERDEMRERGENDANEEPEDADELPTASVRLNTGTSTRAHIVERTFTTAVPH